MQRYLKNLPFNCFTFALLIFVLVCPLMMQGMGGDGLIYSSIAMNMAHGNGSLWAPNFTKTVLSPFYEHPAFAIYLQSFLFRAFGSAFYIEKLYSAIMATINIYFVLLIWREVTHKKYPWIMLWLPLLCWLAIPVNTYAYNTVVLQCTLTSFVVVASYYLVCYLKTYRAIRYFYLLIGAIFISAAFFANGIQGFVPLAFFFVVWICLRTFKFWAMVWHSFLLSVLTTLCIGMVLVHQAARYATITYLKTQLFATIDGSRAGRFPGWMHLHVFWMLFNNLLPLFILVGLIYLYVVKVRKWSVDFGVGKKLMQWIGAFLLLGFIASMPVMLSSRQQPHYLLQAYPYFALAFALWLSPLCAVWIKNIDLQGSVYKVGAFLMGLLLLFSLVFTAVKAGKVHRDAKLLHDVRKLGSIIPPGAIINIAPAINTQSMYDSYLYRFTQISLAPGYGREYLLTDAAHPPTAKLGYTPENLDLRMFVLYKKSVSKP